MNNQEALKKLRYQVECWKKGKDFEYEIEPLYLAISALEEQERRRWVPVEERLPEEVDERQDILLLMSSGRIVIANYVQTANKGKIFFDGYDMFYPVAWQPLPEPYKPEEGDK